MKKRKEIEDEILMDERLGDEEDYEEYARLRDAREGQRAIRSRIDEEEEIRQNREFERREKKPHGQELFPRADPAARGSIGGICHLHEIAAADR